MMFRKVAPSVAAGVFASVVSVVPTNVSVSTTSSATALCTSRRSYLQLSRVCRNDATQQQAPPPPPTSDGAAAAPSGGSSASNESALDVAMRVNKMKKLHQGGGAGANKKQLEQDAWQALNSLTEDQINNAEGKAVSLLLNSWAYFAKFWAKGKDGPL